MKKFRFIGIIALAAMMLFAFLACSSPTGGDTGPGPKTARTVTYSGVSGTTQVKLEITENLNPTSKGTTYEAQPEDSYTLTFDENEKVSTGTVTDVSSDGVVLILQPSVSGSAAFEATVTGNNLSKIDGTITWDNTNLAPLVAPDDLIFDLTGAVTIDKTSPLVGDTLTAAYTPGNGTGAATWQWFAGDAVIANAVSDTYTVASGDLGNTLKAQVSFADQNGAKTSNDTAAVAAAKPALTGTVTIDKTSPVVGDTLTASYSSGNGSGTVTWKWLSNDVVISGASSTTYKVAASDQGKTLKAQVSFADQSGSITSGATNAVGPAPKPTLTGTVTISNYSPVVGETLTATYSGNGTGTATWVWLADDTVISGASSSSYTVATGDQGKTLKARVSYANQNGVVTSNATAAVVTSSKPILTGTVTLSNTSPVVYETLTAVYTPGNGSGTAVWQWLVNDIVVQTGNGWDTYKVSSNDLGKIIKAQVSFTDQSTVVASNASAAVIANPYLGFYTGTVKISGVNVPVAVRITDTRWYYSADPDTCPDKSFNAPQNSDYRLSKNTFSVNWYPIDTATVTGNTLLIHFLDPNYSDASLTKYSADNPFLGTWSGTVTEVNAWYPENNQTVPIKFVITDTTYDMYFNGNLAYPHFPISLFSANINFDYETVYPGYLYFFGGNTIKLVVFDFWHSPQIFTANATLTKE